MPCVTALNWEIHTACPSIRIGNPLGWVRDSGAWDLHQAISPSDGDDNVSIDIRRDLADVLVFQRQFDFFEDHRMLRTLRGWGVPMVYDVDDDFINIPDDHPIRDVLLGLRKNVMNLLSICDVTVTATPELADLYRPYARRVEVIPNSINPDLWNRANRSGSGEDVTIGYAGTESHAPDLALIEDALLTVLDERPGTRLKLWGCRTPRLEAHPGCTVISAYNLSYAGYARDFQAHDVDVALAPLVDTDFNRAKSAIKWMEYSIGSIPGIYSRLPAYERRIDDGVDGLLCGPDPAHWTRALTTLIDDPGLRGRLGTAARRRVLDEALPEHSGRLWKTLLDDLRRPEARPRPEVSTTVIIPVYNRADLTGPCLDAVTGNSPDDIEVIVVDNASGDDMRRLLDDWRDRITVVRNAWNLGYAMANNQAAALARGNELVMLNNDTEVRPGWLAALRARRRATGAGIVGARLMYPDGTLQHGGIALYPDDDRPHVIYCGIDGADPHFDMLAGIARPFQMVSAACWLVDRDLFDSLGGFDEGYVNGYEDLDFCLRAGEAGAAVWYEPAAVVVHHESQTSGRADHTDLNEQRLFGSWRGRWTPDLDLYLEEDGMRWTGAAFEPLGNTVLENNFSLLFRRFPELADAVRVHREGWRGRRLIFNEQRTSLQADLGTKKVWLHSRRDPEREAGRLAERIIEEQPEGEIRIAGFGMGWHVEAVRQRAPERPVRVAILDLLAFRRALSVRDLATLLDDPGLTLVRRIDPPCFLLPALRTHGT